MVGGIGDVDDFRLRVVEQLLPGVVDLRHPFFSAAARACSGVREAIATGRKPAYNEAGFRPVAIASRTPEHARAAAEENEVPKVYDTWQELLDDPDVEIVDIAYPPDQQLEIVREAASRPHVKGTSGRNRLRSRSRRLVEIVKVCDEAGKVRASPTTCATTSRCGR